MDRHIPIQGIGESAAVPDRCNTDLRVWATGRTVAESTEQMANASRAVVAALAGVRPDARTATVEVRVIYALA